LCLDTAFVLIEGHPFKTKAGPPARYDKTARNFLAAIYLAAAVIWLH
jgi:hypothetical protein